MEEEEKEMKFIYEIQGWKVAKKFGPFLDLCVSSLRRGHANLLCIVPILSDVSEETNISLCFLFI